MTELLPKHKKNNKKNTKKDSRKSKLLKTMSFPYSKTPISPNLRKPQKKINTSQLPSTQIPNLIQHKINVKDLTRHFIVIGANLIFCEFSEFRGF